MLFAGPQPRRKRAYSSHQGYCIDTEEDCLLPREPSDSIGEEPSAQRIHQLSVKQSKENTEKPVTSDFLKAQITALYQEKAAIERELLATATLARELERENAEIRKELQNFKTLDQQSKQQSLVKETVKSQTTEIFMLSQDLRHARQALDELTEQVHNYTLINSTLATEVTEMLVKAKTALRNSINADHFALHLLSNVQFKASLSMDLEEVRQLIKARLEQTNAQIAELPWVELPEPETERFSKISVCDD